MLKLIHQQSTTTLTQYHNRRLQAHAVCLTMNNTNVALQNKFIELSYMFVVKAIHKRS